MAEGLPGVAYEQLHVLETPLEGRLAEEKLPKEHGREMEAKFAILKTDMSPKGLEKLKIEQSYFPTHAIPDIVRRVMREHPSFTLNEPLDKYKNARIRVTESDEGGKYYFTMKGSKAKETNECDEEETEITKQLYKEIASEATDGVIRKHRYILHGTITLDGYPRPLEVKAEIDDLKDVSGENARELPFYIVEIEFHDPEALRAFRRIFATGEHSFPFLRNGVDVTNDTSCGMRSLATRGFTEKIRNAHKRISRQLLKN